MAERTAEAAKGVRRGTSGAAEVAQPVDARVDLAEVGAAGRRSHQAFLLRFSDALRAEPNPDAVAHLAIRLLAYELDVDRCYVASIHHAADRADITHGFSRLGAPPLPPSVRMSDFPVVLRHVFSRTVVFPDIARQPELTDRDRQSLAAMEFGGLVAGVVRRGPDNPVWALGAVSKAPRAWTHDDVALVEEATERTWVAIERVRAQNALAASERKYRTLFESMDEGFCIIEKSKTPPDEPMDFCWIEGNPAFVRHTQLVDPIGRSMRESFGADAAEAIDIYNRVLASGEPVRFEYAMPSLGRTFELHAFRLGDEDSRQVAMLFQDITVRRQAERVTTRLASIVDSSDDAIVSKGLDGVIRSWNAAAEKMFGYTAQEAIGRSIVELIIPDDRQDEEADILHRLARGEAIDHFETVRRRKDGSTLEISVTISPLYAHGRVIGASKIARDITIRKRAAERQQVLIAELQHRTRNLIGVVRAMAAQTVRSSASLDAFEEAFDGRLQALAGVHGLLSRADEEPITLGALITMELNALGAAAATDRIHVDGPQVRLRNAIVQTLALAIHELATNARKYGALAMPDGRLRVQWSVNSQHDGQRLLIEWNESGIDAGAHTADAEGGYGRKLIEEALPYALDATTQYVLAGGQLHCSIELPLQSS